MDGSGSILKVNSDKETKDGDQLKVYQDSIRFLSPKEVANLHCFPNDFGNCSLRHILNMVTNKNNLCSIISRISG